ncbi:MAG: PucR family transcriptional regulator ligand-binding domain-containing protein [Bacillota bacterium]|nr:PucR family transcriptional regulator ligand-binding domain-containing protein [Bacillota bacterium]
MAISVMEALRIGKLQRARVLAGRRGLGRLIEHVDVIEMPEIDPWVRANVLYLTSFYAIRDNLRTQQDLIRYLAAHGAAAIALDTKSYLNGAPPQVLEVAESCDFPVIEIPEDASYIDIITPVLEAVFTRKRSRDDFLEDLLEGNVKPEAIQQRARYLAWKLDGKRTVLIVDLDDFQSFCLSGRLSERAIQELKRRFLAVVAETTHRTLAGEHVVAPRSDSVVILAQVPDDNLSPTSPYPCPLPPAPRATIEDLALRVKQAAARVLPGLTLSVGIGLLCNCPSQIAESFAAAGDALNISLGLAGGDRIAFYQDLGIHRLLLRIGPQAELERFVSEEIGPLIEHDRRRGSQLVRTLEVFLDSGCHLERAASRLYVHRNSLKYRLTRIKQLLRLTSLEGERLASLAFAVKAHRILTERNRADAR